MSRYRDALLGAEIDERECKAVLRRIKEVRLPRLKTGLAPLEWTPLIG